MVLDQTVIVERDGVKLAVKKFSDLPGLKWILSLPFKALYPFTLSACERLKREYTFFKGEHEKFKTPKVYLVDWKEKILEREFIEGVKLSEADVVEAAGILASTLAWLHREGWCLGDSKPSNFILKNRTVYIIDGEQAVRNSSENYRVWDLAFSLFSLGASKPLDTMMDSYDMKILRRFSHSYLKAGGRLSLLKLAVRALNLPPA
ncbi:MAG: Mn2+-dependent serine/threonine protein kinase [Candidatus Hecatellales archaeon B24]|nr:MAG: Mn2+-dependent serine/threonine protein kinase [Candidatus Hecatellales archaeon B24]